MRKKEGPFMANETPEVKAKPSLAMEFKKLLRNKDTLVASVTQGLQSKNAKVRSLAIKAAFKLKDQAFLKKNILPLISSEKSKKVLRTLSDKITRRELVKKVRAIHIAKKANSGAKVDTTPGEVPKS
jgi:hypothetical protein